MSTISVTNIADGDAVTAASINNQVNTIVNDYNGNITAANLASNAVTDAKITANNLLTTKFSNLYKFNVYRNAAWTDGNGTYALVTFDTKVFDTSTNYSTSTGKFTAPVAGFYCFTWWVSASITASSLYFTQLYVNGVGVVGGNSGQQGTGGFQKTSVGSVIYQLAANDYVQVYSYGSGSSGLTGQAVTGFSGFLVSSI